MSRVKDSGTHLPFFWLSLNIIRRVSKSVLQPTALSVRNEKIKTEVDESIKEHFAKSQAKSFVARLNLKIY